MMQWPGGRILQRHELDAFLAQAVSNQLYEPDQLQELKVGVWRSKLNYAACDVHVLNIVIGISMAVKWLSCLCLSFAMVRWRKWITVVCSWPLSLWAVWTLPFLWMMCAASRSHGITAARGASSMASCFRANLQRLLETGLLCWTCVKARYRSCHFYPAFHFLPLNLTEFFCHFLNF